MKTLIIALLAIAGSASAFAGVPPIDGRLPDGGASVFLLAIGLAGLGAVRRAIRR